MRKLLLSYFLYFQNWWMPGGRLYRAEFLGPLWSLAIEEQFYLIWPACVWRLSKGTLIKVCLLGVGIAFGLRLSLMLRGSSALTYVAYMNTFARMDALLAGGLCALIVRNQNVLERVRTGMPIAIAAIMIGLLLLVRRGYTMWNDQGVMIFGHSLLAVAFACVVLLAYIVNDSKTLFDRALGMKPLTFMGKYSYGIYVYQGLAVAVALHVVRHYPIAGSRGFAPTVGACWLIATIVIAYFSCHLFEKKFLRMKRSAGELGNV